MRAPSASTPRLALALALALPACEKTGGVALLVVTPDGGDPFFPPDAATQARVIVEDDVTPPRTVDVAPNGAFSVTVQPANPENATRVVLEALAAGAVVASGATPPLPWQGISGIILPIFVQRRDTLAPVPEGLLVARTAPHLVDVPGSFVAAVGGAGRYAAIDLYDLAYLNRVAGAVSIDGEYDAEASVVPLAGGLVLLLRGCSALVWSTSANTLSRPTHMPPPERCEVVGSTAVLEPDGGALLLGGRTPSGVVARVDQVYPDGTWRTLAPLTVPRVHPAAARLGPWQALVAGGQGRAGTFLERYDWALGARPVATGRDDVDGRDRAALVLAGDGVALALGGTMPGSTDLAPDDAVLDTRCLGGGCPVLLGTPRLLAQRRAGAVAALAEGGRVVVASGAAPEGVAAAVEIVDASTPRAPVAAGTIGELPYAGLSMLPLATGSVLIAGGGRQEGWFYRH